MAQPILFIDDDINLLKSFKRTFSGKFRVFTADSAEKGLLTIKEQGPFPVIVSDMQMPKMNGIEFLGRCKIVCPDTVRILLTGCADQQTAIDAVNKGDVFRFLTKPCDPDTLASVINDGIRQYQLIVSEKELLEQTLLGTISVLSQILSLINPEAQGFADRLKKYCCHITDKLELEDGWLFEMAAILSQLGCLTIPPEVLRKYVAGRTLNDMELDMLKKHPSIAVKLLMHVPRLENIVEIIAFQEKPYAEFPQCYDPAQYNKVYLGAQMLHVAIGLDRLLLAGTPPENALQLMSEKKKLYNPILVESLTSYNFGLQNMIRLNVHCAELTTRMILDENIYTVKGVLLASKGQKVTEPLLMGMLNYAQTVGVKEPFGVHVPLCDYEYMA